MGKTILITGAFSGIGEACANLFAERMGEFMDEPSVSNSHS
jgi:NAD(P)-dependent dehydrogenase (short-subunit alcohol dehydrogenase family)